MAWEFNWDVTLPDGGDAGSTLDDRIQEFKKMIGERCGDIYGLQVGENTDTNVGFIKARFHVQSSNPTAVANKYLVYAKDVGSKAELHGIDEDSKVVQITDKGRLKGYTSRVRAHKTSNQTVTAGSETQLTFVEVYDGATEYASDTFTAEVDGYYLVICDITAQTAYNDRAVQVKIYKNASAYSTSTLFLPDAGSYGSLCITDIIQLDATETIKIYGRAPSDIAASFSYTQTLAGGCSLIIHRMS